MEPAQELQVVEATIIPAERVSWGNTAAKELMRVVKEVGLSRKFGGDRPHLYAEAWQILARFSGYHGIVDEPVEIMDEGKIAGFKAQAHIYDRDGREVSRATSMCLRDEGNWRNKPLFQLASMAQTRALSKAYRLDLGWIAVLAGYSPTPAEEMDDVPQSQLSKPKVGKPESIKPSSLDERKTKATEWLTKHGKGVKDAENYLKTSYAAWTEEDLEALIVWGKKGFPPEEEIFGT